MTIKLVALDLDGTLVDESLVVTPRTKAAIQRAQNEYGIKIIVATGRMFPSTVPFARMLNTIEPVVCYQGGMIREQLLGNEDIQQFPVMFHLPIPIDVAKALIDLINEHQLHANVYVNDQLYTNQQNLNSRYYQQISGVIPTHVESFDEILIGPPTKIMIIDDMSEEWVKIIHERFGDVVSVCLSRPTFCEIVHKDVSKWRAIQELMTRFGLDVSEVMAIGDHENDMSMISQAGVGVAMGNAPDHVKQCARFVTKSVEEDGVAFALEQWVFNVV